MKVLFPSLEARFNGSPLLRRVGRKLYRRSRDELGTPADSRGPHTIVFPYQDHDTLDTFDSDIERYFLEFRFFSKSPIPKDADNWLDQMYDSFDDCTLGSTLFHTAEFHRIGVTDPHLDGGAWVAAVKYRIVIQRFQMVPAVRGT